jgi:hypothetical protein
VSVRLRTKGHGVGWLVTLQTGLDASEKHAASSLKVEMPSERDTVKSCKGIAMFWEKHAASIFSVVNLNV